MQSNRPRFVSARNASAQASCPLNAAAPWAGSRLEDDASSQGGYLIRADSSQ